MATPPTYKNIAEAYFSTTGATKTITIPSDTVAGDILLLQWAGGSALDSEPAGWTKVQEVTDGPQHIVWYRVAQSGDASSAVVIPATTTAKSFLRILSYSGGNTATPVSGSTSAIEATSASIHASATLASQPADARVVQFFAAKDGATASSTLTVGAGYTQRGTTLTSGGVAFQFLSAAAGSTAGTTAGTVASVNWTQDQATATSTTITLTLTAPSSAVAVRPVADTILPAGTTFDGGTTIYGVTADNDPATRAKFALSGTAVTPEIRFATLTSPLTNIEVDVQCSPGTATLSMVVGLYNAATLIRSYAAFTTVNTSGVATFSTAVSGPDQVSQTTLSDIRLRLTLTGS